MINLSSVEENAKNNLYEYNKILYYSCIHHNFGWM